MGVDLSLRSMRYRVRVRGTRYGTTESAGDLGHLPGVALRLACARFDRLPGNLCSFATVAGLRHVVQALHLDPHLSAMAQRGRMSRENLPVCPSRMVPISQISGGNGVGMFALRAISAITEMRYPAIVEPRGESRRVARLQLADMWQKGPVVRETVFVARSSSGQTPLARDQLGSRARWTTAPQSKPKPQRKALLWSLRAPTAGAARCPPCHAGVTGNHESGPRPSPPPPGAGGRLPRDRRHDL